MTTNKKAARAGTHTASKALFDSRNHTGTDPLVGWFNLAKSSRINRQQKRGWQRGARK
jgi:hypothetical protein